MGNTCPCPSAAGYDGPTDAYCQSWPGCCPIPAGQCVSGVSSVRRVSSVSSISMIFTSASNPILYKGVSVNQAGYASLTQANLGGRTISNARTLINNA
jgi:hypothetical protein